MIVLRPHYVDPFNPLLLKSEKLDVSIEQKLLIHEVLMKSSSDSRFAEKAYESIIVILTAGPTPIPEVTSLTPNTAVVGDPSFDVHVHGKNFHDGSVIVFNGIEEPTMLVSDTEVKTGVDMSIWTTADTVQIGVANDGVQSNLMDFTFTDPASGGLNVGKKGPVPPTNPSHSGSAASTGTLAAEPSKEDTNKVNPLHPEQGKK